MTIHVKMQRCVLLIFLCVTMAACILVPKHKPQATKQISGNKNNKSRVNETVREKYTTGVCQEGHDDVTLYKQTHEQCFTECRSRSLCTAINFYTKVGVCRLNFQKNLTTTVCQKYIFSEKKNWKQKSIPGCEKQECLKTHKCVVNKGKPSCVATGCENIKSIAHGVMYGNLVEVGKSRGFRCNKGYNLIGSKKITCQPNGQWSDKVPVCSAEKAKSDMETPKTTTRTTKTTTKTPPSSPPPTITVEATTKSNTTSQIPSFPTAPGETILTTDINKTIPTTKTIQSHSTKQSSTQALTTELSTTYSNTTITYTLSTEIESNTYSNFWGQISTESARKDRFFNGYNDSCNSMNGGCRESRQECRHGICQCMFPLVYDPVSYSCVTGCTALGSSYQQHDGMFISDSAATQKHKERTYSVLTCLDLCTNTPLCTFLAIKEDVGEMICTLYEGPLSDILPVPLEGYTSFLRNCGDQESGFVVGGSVRINGGESAGLVPPDKNNESDASSTDTTVTKTDEMTTERSAEKEDPPSTDASNGALNDDSTTMPSVASPDQSGTSTSTTGDSKIPRDISIYGSPKECGRGFVYCYSRHTCAQDCGIMADTFQVFYTTIVRYAVDDQVEEFEQSTNLEECLHNCTQISNCKLVTRVLHNNDLAICTIVSTSGIFSKELFHHEERMTVFVRDCRVPVTREA